MPVVMRKKWDRLFSDILDLRLLDQQKVKCQITEHYKGRKFDFKGYVLFWCPALLCPLLSSSRMIYWIAPKPTVTSRLETSENTNKKRNQEGLKCGYFFGGWKCKISIEGIWIGFMWSLFHTSWNLREKSNELHWSGNGRFNKDFPHQICF